MSRNQFFAAAFSLAWPRDALLDESSAKVGIHEACLRTIDGFNERHIRYALFALEAPEGLGRIDPHLQSSPALSTIAQQAIVLQQPRRRGIEPRLPTVTYLLLLIGSYVVQSKVP